MKFLKNSGTNEKEKKCKPDQKDISSSESGDVEESDTSSGESSHSEESSPPHSPAHRRGPFRRRPRFLTRRFFQKNKINNNRFLDFIYFVLNRSGEEEEGNGLRHCRLEAIKINNGNTKNELRDKCDLCWREELQFLKRK